MKRILITFCILTSFSCSTRKSLDENGLNSDNIENKWYLVTRNNLRVTEIKLDSIHTYTTNNFILNSISGRKKSNKILNRHIENNKVKFEIEENNKIKTLYFELDNNQPKRLKWNIANVDTENLSPFQLVQEKELKSYEKLKDISQITPDNFIDFATKLIELKNQFVKKNLSRHYLYSEMKYILVDLDYNPLIPMKSIDSMIEKFSNQTQDICKKLVGN